MQISYQNIDESLNSLDKIYTISGDEPLFIQETKEKIRKKCINAGYTDRESIVVAKDYNWSYLLKSSENIDMFDDQKILELKMTGNGPGINGSKVLKTYLKQPTESQILIISLEGLDKKTLSGAWVKDLQKYSTFITVKSLRTSEITPWIICFVTTILDAHTYAEKQIEFTINKAKFFDRFKDQLNDRQLKVVRRILKEGLKGFEGGMNTKNYISITGTSKATATRDLQDLTEKGVLIPSGGGRSTHYEINLA